MWDLEGRYHVTSLQGPSANMNIQNRLAGTGKGEGWDEWREWRGDAHTRT